MRDWRILKDKVGLTTDALWLTTPLKKDDGRFIIPNREIFNDYDRSFHGLFIPEIPYQFILRFAYDNGWIWDCFAGSGTTFYVAKKLHCENRVICSDIDNRGNNYIIEGDARKFSPLKITEGELIKLVFFHPPYFNIIKFSDREGELSSIKDLDEFLSELKKSVVNVCKYVCPGGFVILVCGNIWYNREEIDLGVLVKEMFRDNGFNCRSHIVKDYGETKNMGKGYNLQYFRNIKNVTNFFYGDNIFVLKKK